MVLKKGGIYNPKTKTYFVGGQGYSVASDPNTPSNPLTKAVEETKKKKSSGGGGGSSQSTPQPQSTPTSPQTKPDVMATTSNPLSPQVQQDRKSVV